MIKRYIILALLGIGMPFFVLAQDQAPPVGGSGGQSGPPPGGQQYGPPPGGQYGGQYGPPPGQQFGPPPGGQFGPPAGGQFGPMQGPMMRGPMMEGGQFGPQQGGEFDQSKMEEQQARQQEQMEKQMKQQEARQLKQIKQGMSQFKRGIAQFKKMVSGFAKQGIAVPAELADALAKADTLFSTIENAQSLEEIMEVQEEMMSIGEVMQEWGPRLGHLQQMPRVIKQAEKELKKLENALKKDQTRARTAKFDISGLVSAFEAEINKLKAILDEVKNLLNSDPEEAMDKLQAEFFEGLGDAWDKDQTIQMIIGFTRGVTQISRQIKTDESMIKKLKRQKLDTAELEALVEQAKEKLAEVQALVKNKDFEPEDFVSVMEELGQLQHEFDEKVEDLTGELEYKPQYQKGPAVNVQIPDFFRQQGRPQEEEKDF